MKKIYIMKTENGFKLNEAEYFPKLKYRIVPYSKTYIFPVFQVRHFFFFSFFFFFFFWQASLKLCLPIIWKNLSL